ncbi:MAG: UDP-N-acetylmuramoyl-L-alanyl-D-glutamate--2,6-diaminopimelate ligase [Bacteroidales bacterium]|nr:UDP-N-acetylmuramoyl-L-alanyl-D-glutamate--2,6-diaminopimelate ligase [Bacteroidales bacterium]
MKRLGDILFGCKIIETIGSIKIPVSKLVFDSRQVMPGSLFFALKGTISDGHAFIQIAIDSGATSIVCENLPTVLHEGVTYIRVADSSHCLALSASSFYNHPSAKLKLVGVTGTNGKTTVATLLFRLFTSAGFYCGLLSTIENKIGVKTIAATHTTPDPIAINSLLATMVDEGCTFAFMEVSSHAIDQNRTSGLYFCGGIFTNLTHDHLDYHKTFAAYRDVKKRFFDQLSSDAFAVINADDRNGSIMVQNCKASVATYSLSGDAEFKGRVIENHFEGLVLNINGYEIFTCLIGRFNASNLLAIYGASKLLGLTEEEIVKEISQLKSAEGRFEFIRSADNIVGIVDYAHTPDALENVLKTIQEIRTHNEQLITVAGAGGDRDSKKRPEMARIAAELSDRFIITSDNPRTEDPNQIIKDMQAGVPSHRYSRTLTIADRHEAIRTAVALAKPGDIILVAGKGHEKYQDINGVKYPFDDKKELFELLKSR